MAEKTGYAIKWPQWSDKEFDIAIGIDLTGYAGYGIHLVYADRPGADPIAKYSLNTVTGYTKKLGTKSTSATGSVITMYGQRATSGLFEIGKKIDIIIFLQKVDGNYDTNKQPFGDPAEFCSAVKGSKTELLSMV